MHERSGGQRGPGNCKQECGGGMPAGSPGSEATAGGGGHSATAANSKPTHTRQKLIWYFLYSTLLISMATCLAAQAVGARPQGQRQAHDFVCRAFEEVTASRGFLPARDPLQRWVWPPDHCGPRCNIAATTAATTASAQPPSLPDPLQAERSPVCTLGGCAVPSAQVRCGSGAWGAARLAALAAAVPRRRRAGQRRWRRRRW